MSRELKPSAELVQHTVRELGFPFKIVEFSKTTRTAAEAAAAIGCTVGQIAKSLIFKTSPGSPILVIASGANRVDEQVVGKFLEEEIFKADADFVREATGFAIGGVPPVGHPAPIKTLIDQDLFQHEVIWAAAGTPNAVFKLTPEDLIKMTGGVVIPIC
jgi:prolyl-tRNA editing enzyme YbaK/EbsC (Cys-tRNA(Pro) deacylase)